LLRNQFSDDQACIGGDDDHQTEPNRFGGFRIDPKKGKPLTDRLSQAGSRIGAGEDSDQGDPDLNGREETAGLCREVEGEFGSARTRFRHCLQPRLA
jgi:hypothetical protein